MSEVRPVDADQVLLIIEKIKENRDIPKNYGTLLDIERRIRELPTLDYEPVVHAHWIKDISVSLFPICSNCNVINANYSNYCGACGAKMDEEVKE
ncbi:MAG: zinc ribbon domain-containing protein [Eubacterium sp.]|nr:zinc ribbon domain-containing protein [Eubacterium sp.]MDE6752758.1 zinc ribbon domain-containing protein [Eubacterium sp.]